MSLLSRASFRSLNYRIRPLSTAGKRMSSTAMADAQKTASNYKIVDRVVDFEKKQASRPDFEPNRHIEVTKHPNPHWKYGQGVPSRDAALAKHKHREIDPYADGRATVDNYRLLISGVAPRPIGLTSTVSKDGHKNLAPFSYFQVVDHDPPMFIIGFSSRPGREKDTYRNLKETGECVINSVSEDMIEAVNSTSIDAPYGVSEWDVSGLTEAPTTTVAPSRVGESIFSVEGKVLEIKEFAAHSEGMSIAGLVLIKATRFWVREDATNEAGSDIDLEKLRPLGQLGGMSYGRILSTFELPRRRWADECPGSSTLTKLDESKPPN